MGKCKTKRTYAGIEIADPAVKLPQGLTKAKLRKAVAETMAKAGKRVRRTGPSDGKARVTGKSAEAIERAARRYRRTMERLADK